MKNTFIVFVAARLAVAFVSEAQSEDIRGLKLNHSKMGWLASEPDLARNVLEIANAMHHTDGLRARQIICRGSLRSINDLLYLRSADMALLSSDSLAHVKQDKPYKETGKLAKLNVIILARKEAGVIEDLPGMRIATGPAIGDEFIAAEYVFGALGTYYEGATTTRKNSLAALLDGRIDAAVFTCANAYTLLNSIKAKSGLAFPVQAAGSQ